MKIPFISKYLQKRSNLTNPTAWLLDLLGRDYESKTGIKVSSDDAIKVSAVFACVNLVSQTMASLPLNLYERTNIGKVKADDHNLHEILHILPNKETTAFDFWVMYIVNLLLTGDGFAYIKRDGAGKVREMWNIPSANVTKYRNKETDELFYKVKDENGFEAVYYSENIMHTRGMRFKSKDETLDPIALARDALGLAVALEEYGSNYFKNGANQGAVVEYPGFMKDYAFTRFKDSFNEKYAGIGNSSKVLFLESGTTFKKIGNTPTESQAIEVRKFQVIEIARFFNVPPHKIMDLERATFTNIEHQNTEFVQFCLSPMAVRIEQTIYKDLLMPVERKKYYSKFKINALLRGDTQTRKEFYQAGIQNGWFSPNDVREFEDMNTYEGGSVYMVNGNLIPISHIEEYIKLRQGKGGEKGE